jgi:hypothetical protein
MIPGQVGQLRAEMNFFDPDFEVNGRPVPLEGNFRGMAGFDPVSRAVWLSAVQLEVNQTVSLAGSFEACESLRTLDFDALDIRGATRELLARLAPNFPDGRNIAGQIRLHDLSGRLNLPAEPPGDFLRTATLNARAQLDFSSHLIHLAQPELSARAVRANLLVSQFIWSQNQLMELSGRLGLKIDDVTPLPGLRLQALTSQLDFRQQPNQPESLATSLTLAIPQLSFRHPGLGQRQTSLQLQGNGLITPNRGGLERLLLHIALDDFLRGQLSGDLADWGRKNLKLQAELRLKSEAFIKRFPGLIPAKLGLRHLTGLLTATTKISGLIRPSGPEVSIATVIAPAGLGLSLQQPPLTLTNLSGTIAGQAKYGASSPKLSQITTQFQIKNEAIFLGQSLKSAGVPGHLPASLNLTWGEIHGQIQLPHGWKKSGKCEIAGNFDQLTLMLPAWPVIEGRPLNLTVLATIDLTRGGIQLDQGDIRLADWLTASFHGNVEPERDQIDFTGKIAVPNLAAAWSALSLAHRLDLPEDFELAGAGRFVFDLTGQNWQHALLDPSVSPGLKLQSRLDLSHMALHSKSAGFRVDDLQPSIQIGYDSDRQSLNLALRVSLANADWPAYLPAPAQNSSLRLDGDVSDLGLPALLGREKLHPLARLASMNWQLPSYGISGDISASLRPLSPAKNIQLASTLRLADGPLEFPQISLGKVGSLELQLSAQADDFKAARIEGRLKSQGLGLHLAALQMQQIETDLPFAFRIQSQASGLNLIAAQSSPAETREILTALYPSLAPYIRARPNITAERIACQLPLLDEPLVITQSFADLHLVGNSLIVPNFGLSLLGGDARGDITVDRFEQRLVMSIKLAMTNLNLAQILTKVLHAKDIRAKDFQINALIQGSLEFRQISRSHSPRLENFEGSVMITKIGNQALDQLLLILDPSAESPAIQGLRSKIRLGGIAPRYVSIKIQHGNLSLAVYLQGVTPVAYLLHAVSGFSIIGEHIMPRIPVSTLLDIYLKE